RESCFTRTLQASHKYNCWVSCKRNNTFATTHKFGKLFVGYFNQQLPRRYCRKHALTQCFLLNGISKIFGYFVVNVSIDKGFTYFFYGFRYVYLGNRTLALEHFKCPV